MNIQIDPHTLERAQERGVTEDEIIDVLKDGVEIPGKHGRHGKTKTFAYGRKRNDKYYEQKRIEVYYVVESARMITVTVYAFYGKWEASNP